ncbi:MAG TPA: hypothetical protein VMB25_05635 [Bryobacteraceae bacterium]|nr:hypothetical protein [Bryobacteraceae bacterium]
MDQPNAELNRLFAEYRDAVLDPEASAGFMPELWRKIESRQRLVIRIKKLTQVFVAAAAAICLLFGILLQAPRPQQPIVRGNYVDVLADANPTENLAAVGIRIDYTESNTK